MFSQQFNQIARALARAQCEMQNAMADASNPDFNSRYATLAAVRDACVPPLARQGIGTTQIMGRDGNDRLVLFTILLHESGEFIESHFPLPESLLPNEPQAFGSVLEYAKRYSLASIAGIATNKDDDGNLATTILGNMNAPQIMERPGTAFDDDPVRGHTFVEKAPAAPVAVPVAPPPPVPPAKHPDAATPEVLKFIASAMDIGLLVTRFQEWGFTNKNSEPGGLLLDLKRENPDSYELVVAAYLDRLKELTPGKKAAPKKAAE